MSPRDELYGQCPNCGNAIPRCSCTGTAPDDDKAGEVPTETGAGERICRYCDTTEAVCIESMKPPRSAMKCCPECDHRPAQVSQQALLDYIITNPRSNFDTVHNAAINELLAARQEIAALRKEIERLTPNARRYEWLRDNQTREALKRVNSGDAMRALDIAHEEYGDKWDELIDSAISTSTGEKGK